MRLGIIIVVLVCAVVSPVVSTSPPVLIASKPPPQCTGTTFLPVTCMDESVVTVFSGTDGAQGKHGKAGLPGPRGVKGENAVMCNNKRTKIKCASMYENYLKEIHEVRSMDDFLDPNQVVNPFILEEVELTKENIKKYLDHHNKLRAEVGPERATNMLELTWDEDLATVAKAWSRECKLGHSAPENRRTTAFRWTGENAYFRYPPWEIDQVLASSLTSFMKEKPRFTYGKFGASDTGTKYGHYSQMMWANSYKVGCGVTNCGNFYSGVGGEYWAKAQVVICTYGPGGNIVGQYPWESGKTCSNCPADKTCLCTP